MRINHRLLSPAFDSTLDTLKLFILVLLGLGLSASATLAQPILETETRTVRAQGTSGLVWHNLSALGTSVSTMVSYSQLRHERIGKLRQALRECGDCDRSTDLRAQLAYWENLDHAISNAEGAALSTMGLGQYRNFRHMVGSISNDLHSHEYWDRYQKAQEKQQLLLRAKSALDETCFREAIVEGKSDDVRGDGRFLVTKHAFGAKDFRSFIVDREKLEACKRSRITSQNQAIYASQHEIAVSMCRPYWTIASNYFAAKGTKLHHDESIIFNSECVRANSPIESALSSGPTAVAFRNRRDLMVSYVYNRCSLDTTPAACRSKHDIDRMTHESLTVVTNCRGQALSSKDESAFMTYFECLRAKDPRFPLAQDIAVSMDSIRDARLTLEEQRRACNGPPVEVRPGPDNCWMVQWMIGRDQFSISQRSGRRIVQAQFWQKGLVSGELSEDGMTALVSYRNLAAYQRASGFMVMKLDPSDGTKLTASDWATEADFRSGKPPRNTESGSWMDTDRRKYPPLPK